MAAADRFDSGVSAYIHARAEVDVYFPVDRRGSADVSCNQCRFFRRSYRSCGLNGAVCEYPDKFVGGACPLEIIDTEEKQHETN